MNRFQSIVDGITATTLEDLTRLKTQATHGYWYIGDDGMLHVQVNEEDYTFTFERGDPDSEMIVLLLNNIHHMLSSFRSAQ